MTKVHITCTQGMPPGLDLSIVPVLTSFYPEVLDALILTLREVCIEESTWNALEHEKATVQENRTQFLPLAGIVCV